MENQLLVRKIENGTVIDHVPPWHSDMVLRLLDLERIRASEDVSVLSLNNVLSVRYGRKDIVKLNNYHLDEGDADIVCLVYPTATVNYIEDWEPTKYRPKVPECIVGRLRCPELSCVTNSPREPIVTRFRVLPEYEMLQCMYCDSLLEFEKVPEYVKSR